MDEQFGSQLRMVLHVVLMEGVIASELSRKQKWNEC